MTRPEELLSPVWLQAFILLSQLGLRRCAELEGTDTTALEEF